MDRPSDDSALEKHCPKLKKKKQISRGVGIFVSVILMLALITTLLNMMIPELYGSIRDMIFTVPSQMNRFINEFSKMHSSDSTVGKYAGNIIAFPTTVLVDKGGNIISEPFMGGIDDQANYEQLMKQIQSILDKK